jgi:hypothetical protein
VTKPRYECTLCRTCAYQGPPVHVAGGDRETCLRHRRGGEAQVLSPGWIADLEAGKAWCELYRPPEEAC